MLKTILEFLKSLFKTKEKKVVKGGGSENPPQPDNGKDEKLD